MTETTERTVLMICGRCGKKENIPLWILEELNEFGSDDKLQCMCPKCNSCMYPADSDNNSDR